MTLADVTRNHQLRDALAGALRILHSLLYACPSTYHYNRRAWEDSRRNAEALAHALNAADVLDLLDRCEMAWHLQGENEHPKLSEYLQRPELVQELATTADELSSYHVAWTDLTDFQHRIVESLLGQPAGTTVRQLHLFRAAGKDNRDPRLAKADLPKLVDGLVLKLTSDGYALAVIPVGAPMERAHPSWTRT